jgi:hypothetical protein
MPGQKNISLPGFTPAESLKNFNNITQKLTFVPISFPDGKNT